ncbi:UNVERIFIED_CONTAM: hypothetical protein FKN15_071176 [Acipenser sinensis]
MREHIEAAGHTCVLRDTADFKNPEDVADLIAEEKYEGALAIHLYKSGRLLLDSCIPFGIVFGGTDINEDVKGETKRPVMGQVLQKAREHIEAAGHTCVLRDTADFKNPEDVADLIAEEKYEGALAIHLYKSGRLLLGIDNENVEDLHVFILVCGLRRVKDPLYLVNVFSEWHVEDPSVYLIIIGPELWDKCSSINMSEMYGKQRPLPVSKLSAPEKTGAVKLFARNISADYISERHIP